MVIFLNHIVSMSASLRVEPSSPCHKTKRGETTTSELRSETSCAVSADLPDQQSSGHLGVHAQQSVPGWLVNTECFCLSGILFFCFYVFLFFCLYVFLFVCLYVFFCFFLCVFVFCLYVCMFVCLYVFLFVLVYMFVCLYVSGWVVGEDLSACLPHLDRCCGQ